MASLLTDLAAHIRHGDATPFELGVMDCSLWAADWVRICTGRDLAAGWRGQYSTRREYMRLLLCDGGLVRVTARAMQAIGATLVAPAGAQPGDIGIVMTTDGPALAVHGPRDWLAKIGDKLAVCPACSFAWRI
jgi:hypothetical protein